MADLPIRGPLGIWPFPVLNAIVLATGNDDGGGTSISEYNVVRDDSGRIEKVEMIEGLGDNG